MRTWPILLLTFSAVSAFAERLQDASVARSGDANRVHIALNRGLNGIHADWSIAPAYTRGAKLYRSATGGTPQTSISAADEVWVEPGAELVPYTITANLDRYGVRAVAHLTVCSILFEPVTTEQYGGEIVNPCCCVVGRPSYFKISVEPHLIIPDSDITWVADNPNLLAAGSLSGRIVAVNPSCEGENGLTVKIAGYNGPDPYIKFSGVTETVTSVYVWIVGDDAGTHYARTGTEVTDMFNEVNRIYRQVGMRFVMENIAFTNNSEYLNLLRVGNSYRNASEICNIAQNTGGLEFYFVDSIDGYRVSAANIRGPNATKLGIIASTNATGVTLAHEIGHSCGLKDIYRTYTGVSEFVSGPISRDRIVEDWGTKSDIGYYPTGLTQYAFIERLLMYGMKHDSSQDISCGDIFGLYYEISSIGKTWLTDLVSIGFFDNGNRNPVHQ